MEHLASAMVARLLADLAPRTAVPSDRVAVVTTAPTETHEFGAWMVTDLLDGDIARRCDLRTEKGEIIGPLADKLMINLAFVFLAVNQELLMLYWQIGQEILYRQQREGWGSKIIERLANDSELRRRLWLERWRRSAIPPATWPCS